MDEAEVEEVVHLIERQKKRLHFAGSLLRVQPASLELRQLTAFHGLSDQELAKVPLLCCFTNSAALLHRHRCTASLSLLHCFIVIAALLLCITSTSALLPWGTTAMLHRHC